MDKLIKIIHNRFTKLYVFALSAVAILTIAGQILVQISLNDQSTDARVINLAGRQRMLSQRICKNALLITKQINTHQRENQINELKDALSLWAKVQIQLQSTYIVSLGKKTPNSKAVDSLFKQIEPHHLIIITNSKAILANAEKNIADTTSLNQILTNEGNFLKGMNKIVYQYDKEAQAKVKRLKNIEILILLVTLMILFFEGTVVFMPAVEKLTLTMKQLIMAEAQSMKTSQMLSDTHTILKKTELELIQATSEKQAEQMNQQKIRAAALLKGQENERKRIAREMHDGLGQVLTALKLNIESISAHNLDDKNKAILEEARILVGKTIAETRNITFDLMPTVLNDFGLVAALRKLVDHANKPGNLKVMLNENAPINRLDKNIEVSLYRFTQEALNNAIKYAQATKIEISIAIKNQQLYLEINDNGKGFDLGQSLLDYDSKKINQGIHNMQERTNLLNGEFSIKSAIGQGTKICSVIPLY
jgi:signal transduction histidine kinase